MISLCPQNYNLWGKCIGEKDRVIHEIGRGTNGYITLVEHKGEELIREEVDIRRICLENCKRKVKILKELHHENILIVKDSKINRSDNICYIYTEYIKNGSLSDLIRKQNNKDFGLSVIIKYMKDLIDGLKYLYNNGIIHRDLKPDNIKVGENNELKIGGLSLAIEKYSVIMEENVVGTPNYIAPELFSEKAPPYSFESNIYALGCIFYEIYTLKKAFDGSNEDEVKSKIVDRDYVLSFERNNLEKNSSIEKLIKRMLENNPKDRIDIRFIEDGIYIIEEEYNPTTVRFYLFGGSIKGKTLKDICEMSNEEFKDYWEENLVGMMFPTIDQYDPEFTKRDCTKLKFGRDNFFRYLNKLIKMLVVNGKTNEKIIDSISNFLDEIKFSELKFHFEKDDEKDVKDENSIVNLVKIFQMGGVHPIRWIHVADGIIPDCPLQVGDFYYESAEDGNRLLSVKGRPPFFYLEGRKVFGSEGLDDEFLEKYKYGNWWCPTFAFYLQNGLIGEKSFTEISEMEQNQFNKLWKNKYANILFPVVGQDNPPFTNKDLNNLKIRKNRYRNRLNKLLILISNCSEFSSIADSVKLFLNLIEFSYSFDIPNIGQEKSNLVRNASEIYSTTCICS